METVDLSCIKREVRPKGLINRIRREGRVPGVVYGNSHEATAVAVGSIELKARVQTAARQRLIRLKSDAPELNDKYVILKQVQRTPVGGDILHVDFYEVDLNKPLRVSIPLRFTGKAAGIVDGGILQPLERQVEVECLPLEIPEAIDVDVTPLGVHDVLHVSSLKFGANVKPVFDTDYPVVTVLPPTVEAAPVAAAPVEGVEPGAAAEGAAVPPAGAAATTEGAKTAAASGSAPAAAAPKKS